MLTKDQVSEIFITTGTIMEGHFRLTSGLHSGLYVEKFRVLEHPKYTEILCREIARRYENNGVTLVVGPAIGGVIIAYEVARVLGVRSIFCEREEGKLVLRRGFQINPADRVLVVEDIVTTGSSVKEVLDVVASSGATIVGVGLLVDRSNGNVNLGYRTEALLTMQVTTHQPDDCPLCKQGLPVVKPGSRKI
ncbi:MAG: orotate phosphoribosyltransferase [Bacillota bacterium]|nr:MAG: orotate phosphoribosyltransferase [Bacillota bacterium]MBS3949124.1 orotate phosphoribosyltransferase [Peptococcaceae bacterium]